MAEVALLAGVSKPTVSRVISGSAPVTADTRARVLQAIADLGYRPNELARSLSLGRSTSVSVVVPFITHPSSVEYIRGILDGFRGVDYPISIFDVENETDRDSHLESLYATRPPVGSIIIALGLSPDQSSRLLGAEVPTVLIESAQEHLPSVLLDNERAGAMAADHLLRLGHTDIAFIGDTEDSPLGFVGSAQRRKGLEAALSRAGIAMPSAYVKTAEHGREEAQKGALKLLDLPQPPTAVFAASDAQALGVLDAARHRGLRVPEDLSVVGCDDIELAADLGLTTISVGLYGGGKRAAELLLALLDNPDAEPTHVTLEVNLKTRSTTGGVAGG